jgi:hypothetical protein
MLSGARRSFSVAPVKNGFSDGLDAIKWWLKSMSAAELREMLATIEQSDGADNLLSVSADGFDWDGVRLFKESCEAQEGPFPSTHVLPPAAGTAPASTSAAAVAGTSGVAEDPSIITGRAQQAPAGSRSTASTGRHHRSSNTRSIGTCKWWGSS